MCVTSLPPVYVVTDGQQRDHTTITRAVQSANQPGGFMLQLREKDLSTRELVALAQAVHSLTSRSHIPLLINDRVDIVLAVGAEGVHLRSTSLPIAVARQLVGTKRLIGFSAHSVDEVVQGEQEGADFAVLGPIYDTPSKRPYGTPIGLAPLREASQRCRIPVYAIGGLSREKVLEVQQAGAYGVALISSIWQADSPARAIRNYCTLFAVSS